MRPTRIVETLLGAVEVMYLPGDEPPVLFFPGGHCSAANATLVEIDAPSHLFWIGPAHTQVQAAVSGFITATA